MILKIILLTTFFYSFSVNAQEENLNLEQENENIKERQYYINNINTDAVEIIKNSSLFHDNNNLAKLYSILDLIRMGINPKESEELFVDEAEDIKILSKSSVSFYLNAIIYYSKNDWSVWVNNKKITQDINDTDLEILKITDNYVRFRWVTGYSKFVSILEEYYNSGSVLENINITVNDKIATLDFVIKPNQALNVGDEVFIKEGR